MTTTKQADALERLTQRHSRARLVIAGGLIVTMDPALGQIRGDVLIDGNRIIEVGPKIALRAPDAVIIDARDCVVMPGLVDSHVHAWEGQLRGISPDADLEDYLALAHGRLGVHYTPEDIAIGERLTAAQAIHGGVTTIIDNCHNCRTPEHADAAVEALRGSGIRAVFAAAAPIMGEHAGHMPEDLLRLRDRYFSSTDQRLQLRMLTVGGTAEAWTFARQHDFGVVAEMGPWIEDLDAVIGLIRSDHTYNHCVALPERFWLAVADAGASVNVVPRSESQFGLADAFPAIFEAIRHGIGPGLSSDNETAYGMDIFTEMRVLLSQQRGASFAQAFAGSADAPPPLGTSDVLTIATAGGAANAGLADQIGSITAGKLADLVLLRRDGLHMSLVESGVGAVVNYAHIGDVDTVFVDGRPVKWGGKLLTGDASTLTAEAARSRENLLTRADLAATAAGAGHLRARLADDTNTMTDALLGNTGSPRIQNQTQTRLTRPGV